MFDDDAPKVYGLDTINKELPVFVSKDPSTVLLSGTVWLCVGVTVTFVILREALKFLYTITSPAIKRLLIVLNDVLNKENELSSGLSVSEIKT